MKRLISFLLLFAISSAFAWAAPRSAPVVPVKTTHARTQRHRAHKATKHHPPKHHRAQV